MGTGPITGPALRYLVCCWNAAGEFARPDERFQHGEAFLVGKISSIDASPEDAARYIIRFVDFARVSLLGAWPGTRNPVKYSTLSEVGIDPDSLQFETAHEIEPERPSTERGLAPTRARVATVLPLSIEAAKVGLAAHFHTDPSKIEIIIRG